MTQPQQSGDSAFGFSDDHDNNFIPSQAAWQGDSSLGPEFDLGLGPVNLHHPFGPHTQNVDVALHVVDTSAPFTNSFSFPQDHLDNSTAGPSVEQATTLYTGFAGVTQSQQYQAAQAGQFYGPEETPKFPTELSNAFHGMQNFQTPCLSLANQPLCSSRESYLKSAQSDSNKAEKNSTGSHDFSKNSRKRASCDEVQASHPLNVEASEEKNAVEFIQYWRTKYPNTFPLEKEINAFSDLCSLPQSFVKALLNQMLHSGNEKVIRHSQEQLSTKRPKTDNQSQLLNRETELTSDEIFFKNAITEVRRRWPKCKPTLDPAILRRDDARIYQCTLLCGKNFPKKGEWRRHEERNYPQEGWICSLDVTVVVMGYLTCVYCGAQDPGTDHIHRNHATSKPCRPKPLNAHGRIFTRKDRFRNHLEKEHPGISSLEYMNRNHLLINSKFPRRCGFCSEYDFKDWPDRIQHLGDHFEHGKDMSSWNLSSADNFKDGGDRTDDGSLPEDGSPDTTDNERGIPQKHGTSGSRCHTNFGGGNSFAPHVNALFAVAPRVEHDIINTLKDPGQFSKPSSYAATEFQKNTETGVAKSSKLRLIHLKSTVPKTNDRGHSSIDPIQDHDEILVPTRVGKTIRKAVKGEESNHNASMKARPEPATLDPQKAPQFSEWKTDCCATPQPSDNEPPEKRQPQREEKFQLGTNVNNRGLLETSGTKYSKFSSKENTAGEQDATSVTLGIVDFVKLSGGYIHSPKLFNENGTNFSFLSYGQNLSSKPGPVGFRKGPLSKDVRMRANRMRQFKACAPCLVAHRKMAIPVSLAGKGPRLHLLIRFVSGNLWQSILESYLNETEINRLIKEHSHDFKNESLVIEFSCGPLYPSKVLQVCTFRPDTYGLFDSNQPHDDHLERDSGFMRQSSQSLSVVGTYLPDLKRKCSEYINSVALSTTYATLVSSKDISELRKEVLEAVHRLSLSNKNHLLQRAMTLHAMHYFMTHTVTLKGIPATSSTGGLLGSDKSPNSENSSKFLARQIKHTIFTSMCELTRDVLSELEHNLRGRGRKLWAISFSVHLILCMCLEEVSMAASAATLFPHYEHPNKTEKLRNWLESQDLVFQYIKLFHGFFGTHRKPGNNPLRDEVLSAQWQWTDSEIVFITRIKKIIADHGLDKPVIKTEDGSPPKSGQLVSKFIRSFF